MKPGSIVVLFLTAFLGCASRRFQCRIRGGFGETGRCFRPRRDGRHARRPRTGDPGRITALRATLSDLLARAYDVWLDQISGPAWLNDRSAYAYRIDATLPPNTTREQFRLMLQNLLAERFHLRLHHEPRPARLRTGCGQRRAEAEGVGSRCKCGAGQTRRRREWISETARRLQRGLCCTQGWRRGPDSDDSSRDHGQFLPGAGGRHQYVEWNAGRPQARVVDKTGLAGTYEFTLEFAGSMGSPGMMPSAPAEGDPACLWQAIPPEALRTSSPPSRSSSASSW